MCGHLPLSQKFRSSAICSSIGNLTNTSNFYKYQQLEQVPAACLCCNMTVQESRCQACMRLHNLDKDFTRRRHQQECFTVRKTRSQAYLQSHGIDDDFSCRQHAEIMESPYGEEGLQLACDFAKSCAHLGMEVECTAVERSDVDIKAAEWVCSCLLLSGSSFFTVKKRLNTRDSAASALSRSDWKVTRLETCMRLLHRQKRIWICNAPLASGQK